MSNNRKGFSLGEVMLAAVVLLVGILAVLTLMVGSIRVSFQSRDVITATELAQEGVELVKNVRDNDFAGGGTGFPAVFDVAKQHCRLDASALTSFVCTSSHNNNDQYYSLAYSFPNGFRHGSPLTANVEKFRRYVNVQYSAVNREAILTSFVYWGSTIPDNINNPTMAACSIANRCVYIQETLKSWY